MRIFKTKWFVRYARREKIKDAALKEAVSRAEKGIVDGDLGGGIIKQRVARPGQGRSGGYRTLLAYRSGVLAVFLYGFAKSDRENIEDDELQALLDIAGAWLGATGDDLDNQMKKGLAQEVQNDEGE
jgi:hypothetical protein